MITSTVLPIMKRMYVKLGGNSADVESYITVVPVLKKIFVLLGGEASVVEPYNTLAPILDKLVDIVEPGGGSGGISLDSVNIFIGDYHDTSTQTVNYGALNKYDRTLVS